MLMAKNWITGATKNKGGLHRSLGVPIRKVIPLSMVMSAAKKKGKVGAQARLALNLRTLNQGMPASMTSGKTASKKKAKKGKKTGLVFGSPEWRAKYGRKSTSNKA